MWIFWVIYAIVLIATIAAAFLMRPKSQSPQPADFDDIQVPLAEEGKVFPVVFGSVIIDDVNVLWYGNLEIQTVKRKGGK